MVLRTSSDVFGYLERNRRNVLKRNQCGALNSPRVVLTTHPRLPHIPTPKVLFMTDITVTPWERFGLHRGYAHTADGASLGWIDVGTGEVSIHAPAIHEGAVADALRSWAEAHIATLASA